jgi:hypothetical protein
MTCETVTLVDRKTVCYQPLGECLFVMSGASRNERRQQPEE